MTDKFFEDLYKLAGSAMNTAFGTVADMKKQFEEMVDSQIDKILKKRGVVSREEFENVRKMAQLAREKQEELEEKMAKLENKSQKK